MGTVAAPRLDERLHDYIARSSRLTTAAELTRAVGNLAWELGLPRPSYQTVRLRLVDVRGVTPVTRTSQTSPGRLILRAIDVLYEYPGPGLANWYARYLRGGGL